MKIQQQEEKMDVDSTPVKADKKDRVKEDGAHVFVTPMREDPRFSKDENQKRSERYSGVKVRNTGPECCKVFYLVGCSTSVIIFLNMS